MFGLASLLAAALLFAVQPMAAKMLLPRLGGVPAVWTTCLLFFQSVLLVGYAYAHAVARLPMRAQFGAHLTLLAMGAGVLPLTLLDIPTQPDADPLWVLWVLARLLLLPTVLLAASAPLLQSWFTRVAKGRSPYPLYAASNAGSLIALLGYPLWLEPQLSLAAQARVWQLGYYSGAALIVLCGALALRPVGAEPQPAEQVGNTQVAAAGQLAPALWRWTIHAFIPASLLMGATSYASTDLAAVPLLWVVPLALYLLTYIVAFARPKAEPSSRLNGVFVLLTAILVFMFLPQTSASVPLVLVHWFYLTLGALIFHQRLAALQPPTAQLTWFYLSIALGGVLAGFVHALIAPLLFSRVLEYPLTMALACACLPSRVRPSERARQERFVSGLGLAPEQALGASTPSPWPRRLDLLVPLCVALAAAALTRLELGRAARISVALGLPLIVGGLLSLGRRGRFALTIVALVAATQFDPRVIARERSFLGTLRVETMDGYRVLFHGTIIHGRQPTDPARRHEATTYYAPGSPLERVFAARRRAWAKARIAVIGLGVGTLAAYAQPEQRFRFYELDPAVLKLARRHFTYLQDSLAPIQVILGDGRLSLAREPPYIHDVLIADAFSSDAVPLHLLTREALAIYMRALSPGGVLIVNATNRYLRIDNATLALAQDASLFAMVARDRVFNAAGRVASTWVLIARRESDVADLRADKRWQPAPSMSHLRVWTDDYSSILPALRTQR